jgi:diguanylate cyclase (GGDEF)-like protein
MRETITTAAAPHRGADDVLVIAIVEDDPNHALLASEALEERGHRVVVFARAQEALAAHHPGAWDAVVIDYRLPDMTGLEALDCFLAMPTAPPIVMATASGNETVAVSAMKKGARDYVVKTGTHGIELARSVELAVAKQRLHELLATQQREIERRAATDGLTGLLNRHSLDDELARAAERAAQRGEPYTVAMLDVDCFKQINDEYGHAAGDAVLVEVANALRRCTRKRDLLARYGGDEFVIVMPGADRTTCLSVIGRIRDALRSDQACLPGMPFTSVSIGIADSTTGEGRPDRVLSEADRAMYAEKASARQSHG